MQVGEFTVHFRFQKDDELPLSHKKVTAITCSIHPGLCTSALKPCLTEGTVSGKTQCSPRDEFRPAIGRKLALAKALKMLGLTAEQRKAFWDTYHQKMGVPRARRRKHA